MRDLDERLGPIAARERAAMEAGETLDVVLRRLREQDQLGTIDQFHVLRMIKHVGFGIAKQITFDDRHLQLDLDDLALLATIPPVCKASTFLPLDLARAMIEREPRMRVVDAGRRDELKRALDEPAWRREIAIEQDDDDALVVRFVRVPPRR